MHGAAFSLALPLWGHQRGGDHSGARGRGFDVAVLQRGDGQLVAGPIKLQRQATDVAPIPFPDAGLGVNVVMPDSAIASWTAPRHGGHCST